MGFAFVWSWIASKMKKVTSNMAQRLFNFYFYLLFIILYKMAPLEIFWFASLHPCSWVPLHVSASLYPSVLYKPHIKGNQYGKCFCVVKGLVRQLHLLHCVFGTPFGFRARFAHILSDIIMKILFQFSSTYITVMNLLLLKLYTLTRCNKLLMMVICALFFVSVSDTVRFISCWLDIELNR